MDQAGLTDMKYALKIDNKIRVATEDILLEEDVSGELVKFHYRPAIISISPFKDELSLERGGQPPVPTSAVRIADPEGEHYSYLTSRKVTDFKCTYLIYDEGKSVEGSVSDFKFDSGVLSFDVRLPEDSLDKEAMTMFTPVTFQWMEVPNVVQVQVQPTFTKTADVPWKIIGADYRRTNFRHGDPLGMVTPSLTQYHFHLTPYGVNPSTAQEYRNLYPYSSFPSFEMYFLKEEYPLRIKEDGSGNIPYDRLPLYQMFRSYYGLRDVVYNGSSVKALVKRSTHFFDYNNKLYTNHNECLFENTKSHYYDFINNRFRAAYGTYAEGDLVPKGTDIPMMVGAARLLAKDASNAKPDYKYAQVGSAASDNYEIIAYCVAGAGFMWSNGSQYFWRSGGQITTTVGGFPVDERPYHISGIPSIGNADPLLSMFGVSTPSIFSFRFKKQHDRDDIVAPARTGIKGRDQLAISTPLIYMSQFHTFDRLLINTNNFTPDPDNDPDYAAGFLWLGQKHPTDSIRSAASESDLGFYKMFVRYKIRSLTEDVYDIRMIEDEERAEDQVLAPMTLAELQIHSRPLDTDHDYAVFLPSNEALAELPDPDDRRAYRYNRTSRADEIVINPPIITPYATEDEMREGVVELYQLDYYVSRIVLQHTNMTDEDINQLVVDPSLIGNYENRYRGLRIDQLLDIDQLKADVSSAIVYSENGGIQSSGSVSVEEQSASILNNATGRFAVVKSSYLKVSTSGGSPIVMEILDLHIPDEAGYKRVIPEDQTAGNPQLVQTQVYEDAKKRFKQYTNMMSYRPLFNSVTDQQRLSDGVLPDYGVKEAQKYFLDSKYRIIHDPVPQGSEDIGKFFPIAYGRVTRVPMLQVISKISLYEDHETAGDDTYIYASHPCDVRTPHDIVIEYEVEKKTDTESELEQRDRQRSGLSSSIAKSPFPAYLDGHKERAEGMTWFQEMRLWNPYHKLIEKESLDGRKYQGIQLRGGEWRDNAGKADKRYPIRNGFGSTVLYATFGGWVDSFREMSAGRGLLEHPLDILLHYIRQYGRDDSNQTIVNMPSYLNARAKTSFYKASIYLTEPMATSELLGALCEQFGFNYGRKNGEIFFFSPHDMIVDHEKPIYDRLNIVGIPRETSDGYKTSAVAVNYRYMYDYPNDTFLKTISLNSENNEDLARASKGRQNTEVVDIEAKFVADHATATAAALSIAKSLAVHKRYFDVTINPVDGVIPDIGDYVPLTVRRLGVYNLPCYVISVLKKVDGLVDLRLMSVEKSEEAPKRFLTVTAEPPVAPFNISLPTLSGSTSEGGTITSTLGVWAGSSPMSYTRQFYRDGVAISGATGATYTTNSLDLGKMITVEVTATNSVGTSTVVSSSFGPIVASATPPVNLTLPSITGTVRIGSTLTATAGVWSGSPTPTYAYQWYRDGVPITGHTSSTYTVMPSDMDKEVFCAVTATNSAGSVMAMSNSLTSPWRPILIAKPNVVIFDGADPQCYGWASIGDPVEELSSVKGELIFTQGLTSKQGVRTANAIFFDGVDDLYEGEGLFDLPSAGVGFTAICGFGDSDERTSRQTVFSLSGAASSANGRVFFMEYHNKSAPLASRMRVYYHWGSATVASLETLVEPACLSMSLNAAHNNMTLYDVKGSGVFATSAVAATTVNPPYVYATLGALRYSSSATQNYFWHGTIRNFAFDATSEWTEADYLLYRACAQSAGVL